VGFSLDNLPASNHHHRVFFLALALGEYTTMMKKGMAALLTILASLGLLTARAGEKKQPDLKYDMSMLEKHYSLKFKSATVDGTKIKMLLAFTDNIGSNGTADFKRYFTSATYNPPSDPTQYIFYCYCFDEDNVLLCKGTVVAIEGEISGIKDDAFRAVFECSCLAKARKVDLRTAPIEKLEKKDKDKEKDKEKK
jgi:hypothetical protein